MRIGVIKGDATRSLDYIQFMSYGNPKPLNP